MAIKHKNRVSEFINDPKKALFKLAIPSIIAVVVQVLYNIVDTAYVGRLGSDSIAALTFCFPLFFFLISIIAGIAVGMGSKISRFLGAKKKKAAENIAMHGIFLSFITSTLIFIPGFIFLPKLLVLFGASGNSLILALDYMYIVLIGIFFMFPAFILNSVFSSQGDTKTPMKIQIIGLIINIILDPIFIYPLGFGVKGAAIATAISFAITLLMSLYYITKQSYLKIHLSSFKYSYKILKDIFVVGAPASFLMLILSIYIVFINMMMAHFGTDYVAAFGLASKLESVATIPIIAFGTALMTLVGMFFGAKKYHLLKDISWYGIRISVITTCIIGIIFFIFPKLFLRIFTDDPHLLDLSAKYLRIDVFTFPLMAVGMTISRVMQGMGYGFPGLLINLVRVFFVAIPLAYIFVFIFDYGYLSVAVGMVLGGIAATIMGIIWINVKFSHLNRKKDLKMH